MRSGLKSIDVQVDNGTPYHYTAGCSGTDGCSDSIPPWTFNSDAYPDGDHTITVTAKDQLADQPGVDNSRHVSTTSFQVTVDRRGDIYEASELGTNPDELLAQEWGRVGTHQARRVDPDKITTRTTVNCVDNDPSKGQCDEVRLRTRLTDQDPQAKDDYEVTRGMSGDDPSLDIVADILGPARDSGVPAARGPIDQAALAWQTLPPGHGAQYALYQSSIDDDEDGHATRKLWVDDTTKMPVKQEVTFDSRPTEPETIHWTYARGRLTTAEVATDFFSVGRPSKLGKETSVRSEGAAPSHSQTDAETSASFTPYYLGNSATMLGGNIACLGSSDLIQFTSSLAPSDTEIDPELPPSDPYGRDTFVDANYSLVTGAGACVAGSNTVDTPDVEVISYASASTVGTSWRNSYVSDGQAIALDPLDEDALRAGVVPVFIGATPATAYVLVADDSNTSALVEIGGTTVIVTGPFDKTTVQSVIGQLRPE